MHWDCSVVGLHSNACHARAYSSWKQVCLGIWYAYNRMHAHVRTGSCCPQVLLAAAQALPLYPELALLHSRAEDHATALLLLALLPPRLVEGAIAYCRWAPLASQVAARCSSCAWRTFTYSEHTDVQVAVVLLLFSVM